MMRDYKKNPPKVCIICHGLGSGGIESFVVSLATGLKKKMFDVKLVMALDDNGISQFREQEIEEAGIEMFRTSDLGSVTRCFKHMVKLYRYLKSNKFDIVHSNMNMFNGINLAVAWFAGVTVRVAHAHAVESERRSGSIARRVYKTAMHLLILFFANRKCAVSLPAAESSYGKNAVKTGKVLVINNGIDIRKFAKVNEKNYLSKSLITVGRLVAIKNPEFIIQIMSALKEKKYTLIWVGSGELEEKIHSDIEKKGLTNSITMLGARKDIDRLLQTASVFLLPSISEGLSIATLEAQAAGLPCVISDTVPQEVDCGLCTFLSLDESPDVWAEKKDSIVTGRTVKKLDADKLQKFSVDYMVEQVIEMYGLPC